MALPVTRIGHGVRSIEDAAVVAELARRGIVLEVCPSSNMRLNVYARLADHPLRALHESGVRCTLNSDDPAVFETTLALENALARDAFGFSREELAAMNRVALAAAFIDDATRTRLLARL